MRLIFLSLLVISAISAIAQDQKPREILNYSVQFSGSNAEGSFSGLNGQVIFDRNDLNNSKFDVELDPASISTGNDTKNKHARSDNWLGVENYPKIEYRSSKISADGGEYICEGSLRFHGMESNETIRFTAQEEGENLKLTGKMSIDRKEYDIAGSLFGFMVGDEFEVDIEVLLR